MKYLSKQNMKLLNGGQTVLIKDGDILQNLTDLSLNDNATNSPKISMPFGISVILVG